MMIENYEYDVQSQNLNIIPIKSASQWVWSNNIDKNKCGQEVLKHFNCRHSYSIIHVILQFFFFNLLYEYLKQ